MLSDETDDDDVKLLCGLNPCSNGICSLTKSKDGVKDFPL